MWLALYCNMRTRSCNRRKLDASSQIGLTACLSSHSDIACARTDCVLSRSRRAFKLEMIYLYSWFKLCKKKKNRSMPDRWKCYWKLYWLEVKCIRKSFNQRWNFNFFTMQVNARNVLEWDICMICTYKYPSLSNCITTLYRHYRSKPSFYINKQQMALKPILKILIVVIFRIPQLNWGHLFYYIITDCTFFVVNSVQFEIKIEIMIPCAVSVCNKVTLF